MLREAPDMPVRSVEAQESEIGVVWPLQTYFQLSDNMG
jgi:hypothetical protein